MKNKLFTIILLMAGILRSQTAINFGIVKSSLNGFSFMSGVDHKIKKLKLSESVSFDTRSRSSEKIIQGGVLVGYDIKIVKNIMAGIGAGTAVFNYRYPNPETKIIKNQFGIGAVLSSKINFRINRNESVSFGMFSNINSKKTIYGVMLSYEYLFLKTYIKYQNHARKTSS